MRPQHLPHCGERTLVLDPVGSGRVDVGRLVRVSIDSAGVTLRSANRIALCAQPEFDPGALDWLIEATSTDAYAAELVQNDPQMAVRVMRFHRSDRWGAPLRIGVDDLALEQAARLEKRLRSTAEVARWLTQDLVLDDDAPVVVVSSGRSDERNDEAFRLIGRRLEVDVRATDDRLLVERITHRIRDEDDRLWIIHGSVEFQDASRNAPLSAEERSELRRLADADNAYLKIWREYNELERAAASATAREVGWAGYDQCDLLPDGRWEFVLAQSQRADRLRARVASGGVGLEAGARIAVDAETGVKQDSALVIGTATVSETGTILIRPESHPDVAQFPRRGYLSGAFTLDRVRIERRTRAEEAIASGAGAPARQLARILADQPPLAPGRTVRHDPLSARVRTILGGNPTDAQIRAIDMAVNAQDLVLIQGPPGTGKTRVIAAIQARLAEIGSAVSGPSRRVLLTSYQHDAVANLVQSADDGRLPAVKLGRRDDPEDEAYLLAWAAQVADRLATRYAGIPANRQLQVQRELEDQVGAYRDQPGDVRSTVALLAWLSENAATVGSSVAVEARRLAQDLARRLGAATTTGAQLRVLRRARSLRCDAVSFADDGPTMSRHALLDPDFIDGLDRDQLNLLRRTTRSAPLSDDDLASLAGVRDAVIDRVLDSRARTSVVAAIPEVEALLDRAQKQAREEVAAVVTTVDRAVEEFRRAVQEQPEAVRESVRRNTQALAATCQQAVGGAMRTQQPTFDTVIVDEAARANPLDLMIPMSIATGRIVLVGDHRQLPQLIDDGLQAELAGHHKEDAVATALSRSLFERLFTKLDALTRQDGRPRVVTLDQQFRMHPVLGSFVSQQFYEPYGEQVRNGRPDPAEFRHDLARYGEAVCGWIDVPANRGGEKGGRSFSRPVEAEVIATELLAALSENATTTFGVITFYSQQASELWAALHRAGLAVTTERGFALDPGVPQLWTPEGLPRVRVGTVDAFQGREFDVVFLSTTRSNSRRAGQGPRYGFLVLPNRLCVAMSRQRKLLIAVGDAAMFTGDAAREAVPSLAALHDLTGGHGGFRRSA